MSQLASAVGAIPLEVRLFVLVFLGAVIGRAVNAAIYRLAHWPRNIGPWGPPPDGFSERRWCDHLPVIGWLTLRREAAAHGKGFWIRPLLLECAAAAGMALLYRWEVQGGLLPAGLAQRMPQEQLLAITHSQFIAHVVLAALMAAATFIDFDERTIPDAITIPGTLFGLLWSAAAPQAVMISAVSLPSLVSPPSPLWISVPSSPWPAWLDGEKGLLLGLACLTGWCAAIYPSVWASGGGWSKAARMFFASIGRALSRGRRRWAARATACIWLAGAIGMMVVWRSDAGRWPALLSALVGMAAGGALVWAVRIVAGSALGKEAMGFGDVTLMAMIGAYLGWQGALVVFFMAPFAALVIAVAQKLLTGDTAIAFGPYLCLAAAALVVNWNAIWNARAARLFTLGWMIPGLVAFCLVLMGALLLAWSGIKGMAEARRLAAEQANRKKRRK